MFGLPVYCTAHYLTRSASLAQRNLVRAVIPRNRYKNAVIGINKLSIYCQILSYQLLYAGKINNEIDLTYVQYRLSNSYQRFY